MYLRHYILFFRLTRHFKQVFYITQKSILLLSTAVSLFDHIGTTTTERLFCVGTYCREGKGLLTGVFVDL